MKSEWRQLSMYTKSARSEVKVYTFKLTAVIRCGEVDLDEIYYVTALNKENAKYNMESLARRKFPKAKGIQIVEVNKKK